MTVSRLLQQFVAEFYFYIEFFSSRTKERHLIKKHRIKENVLENEREAVLDFNKWCLGIYIYIDFNSTCKYVMIFHSIKYLKR